MGDCCTITDYKKGYTMTEQEELKRLSTLVHAQERLIASLESDHDKARAAREPAAVGFVLTLISTEVFILRNALKRYVRHGFGEKWEKATAAKLLTVLPEITPPADDVVVGSKRKGRKAAATENMRIRAAAKKRIEQEKKK